MAAPYAVAAGHDLTADAAAEALRAGGSAVDACVAGALAAGIAEPVLASLLGGGFLMVREPEGRCRLLDFFVQTPKRKRSAGELDFREIHADFGETTQAFHIGAGAIATPGVARGLCEAHGRYGRLPLRELAQPAAQAARDGLPLAAFQAEVLSIVAPIYTATPEAHALFCDGDRLLAAGAPLRNPALADVLEEYAREGDRFIHEGEVAQAVLALADQGGHLTAEDLRAYRAVWREPLTVRRGAARIALNPPPSLGGALIAFALELMPRDAAPEEVARALALTARARFEADIDRHPAEGAARLLAPEAVAAYRERLKGRAAATRGTTHISAVDGRGMAAALTLSNGEGCGLVARGTGLMPNNMLGEEDLCPNGFDAWTPDARLSSMMAPSAIEWPDGTAAVLGSGGSNRIRTALAQAMRRIVDDGSRLEDAIAAPRIHVEGKEARTDFEDRLPEGDRAALLDAFPEAKGWARDSMFFGGVHAVRRDAKGGVEAAGDPRRAGVARTG